MTWLLVALALVGCSPDWYREAVAGPGLILLSPHLPYSCQSLRGDTGSLVGAADRLRRNAA